MDTNKLTSKSRDAVSAALRTALTEGNPYAEPSHLLHALLQTPGNTVAPLLSAAGADPPSSLRPRRGHLQAASAKGSSVSQPSLSGSFARVLADAEVRAEQLGDAYVATASVDLTRDGRLRRQEGVVRAERQAQCADPRLQ